MLDRAHKKSQARPRCNQLTEAGEVHTTGLDHVYRLALQSTLIVPNPTVFYSGRKVECELLAKPFPAKNCVTDGYK